MNKFKVFALSLAIAMGGGFISINATELSTLCTSLGSSDCKITTDYNTITNHIDFNAANNIEISARIGTFINFGSITTAESNNQAFTIKNNSGYIGHFINYGVIKLNKMSFWVEENSQGIGAITNYGEMGEIGYSKTTTLILNNFGIIGEKTGASISAKNNAKVLIENYALRISEDVGTFSTAKSGSSHLVIDDNSGQGSINFKDATSKLILDFGSNFEFGAGYLFSKLVVDENGNNKLNIDLSRLMPKSDIYLLSQSGQYFIAKLAPQYGVVGSLYRANIRTMNNFYTMSNSMIFPRKYHKSQNLRKSSLRMSEASVAIQDLNVNETFFYQNESQNLQTRRIQRQQRNYSRNLKDSSLRASASERGNPRLNTMKHFSTKTNRRIYKLAESKGRINAIIRVM